MIQKKTKRVVADIEVGDKTLVLETGYLAEQADGAVLARLGDTLVLATVVTEPTREELDYFPLGVEFIERLYAGGRIKGSRWVKREGRPSDEAILTARLIDRSIRPLFDKSYQFRIQVIITVLSVDAENSPDIPAACATSAALAISGVPWKGPVGTVRLGFVAKDGESSFIINPTYQDLEYSEMEMIFSGTDRAVVMIEGKAREIPEKTFLASLDESLIQIKKIIKGINEFADKAGVKKQIFRKLEVDPALVGEIKKAAGKEIEEAVLAPVGEGEAIRDSVSQLVEAMIEKFPEAGSYQVREAVDQLIKKAVRRQILLKKKRIDGRGLKEIRPIAVGVSILPRTHGSAMFKRGKTQALTIATLGAPSLGQLIESMEGEETKRYMHHYYMPPFSTGETGRLGWPSRREIGHGALAESALEPVIPSEEKFPYTVRVVSEIMSSNGSTSMASVCGSTLALMDAGVPIKSPVAGIAMGLISDGKQHLVLSDILGQEDFQGDMDFKVAGSKEGITAIQMDVKNSQIPLKVLKEAFEQAREGRLYILDKMLAVLPASRTQVSKFAPKIEVIHVPTEKIGEVIGPGGRTIKRIISESGATVDIEDDGSVNISSPDRVAVEKAAAMIQGITREVKVDDEFEGTVKRIQPFGAFVEIAPGKEGLVHVSQMSTDFVNDPGEVVEIDQKVKVRVVKIDEMKRINLSMLEKGQKPPERSSRMPGRDPNSGGYDSGRRSSGRFSDRPHPYKRRSDNRRSGFGSRDYRR
ncbi:MAG: polyribonucleotide nucleotidyltransferase [Candidatus Pacebacteria bacterium]|nr:polyribonucleotide nucleotidyltransferase [Candidatus Paceibacterota bacterium]